jgi:hypothetical protein
MSGNAIRHHKETYMMLNNGLQKLMDCSHMSSGELEDILEE